MLFNYKLVDSKGNIKADTVEAINIKEARNRLTLKEGAVISLEPVNQNLKKSARKVKDITFGKVKLIEKVMFAKHLSVMIKAGMPLDDSLEVLMDNASAIMTKRLGQVLNDVRQGNTLSSALRKYPRDFDGLFVNMIAVGESGGTLAKNLNLIAVQQHKSYDLRRKIKAASLYPSIILIAILVLITVISIFVLPKITGFFTTLNIPLPLSTRILIGTSEFFIKQWPMVIGSVVFLILSFKVMLRISVTKYWVHDALLRLPLFGRISKNMNLALMCRTLSSLLDSGITIDRSLQIVSETVTNDAYRKEISVVYHKILKGASLASALTNKKYFPLLVARMTKVGEKSGNLSEVLEYLADFYETEVDNTTKNLSTVLEPALLVFIGLVVGFVAMSIIGPIYELTSKVGA